MKIRKYLVVLFTLMLFFSLAQGVFAFGASADYWDGNSLKLQPGESKEIELRLQNSAGNEEEVILRANVQQGSQFVTLTDSDLDYKVPFGSDNVKVNLLVSVPEDADVGETHELVISFDQLSAADDSFLQLAGAVKKRIPLEIVGDGSTSFYGTVFVVLIIIVALIVALAFIVKRRNK